MSTNALDSTLYEDMYTFELKGKLQRIINKRMILLGLTYTPVIGNVSR